MDGIIIKIEENQIGPLSMSKLRSLFNQGVFEDTDLVWDEKLKDWVQASNVKELDQFFARSGNQD